MNIKEMLNRFLNWKPFENFGNTQTITISGDRKRTLTVKGGDITIINNRVFVDGVELNPGADSVFAITKIIVEGPSSSVRTDNGSIEVTGDCQGDVYSDNGSIDIGGELINKRK